MINLPLNCKVDKFIPKKTFYEKVNISNTIREEFVDKLNKIYWRYKLSEDTINISKTNDVEEIEIFEIELKEKYNSKNVIKVITKNIPYPILFYIKYEEEFQYAIKYEDDIFFSEWNVEIEFKLQGYSLNDIYDNITKSVLQEKDNDGNLEEIVKRNSIIEQYQKQIASLERQLKSEVQFNRKVEINQRLQKLKKDLEEYLNG